MNTKKIRSKRSQRKIEGKKARAAERQALGGGVHRLVRGMGWSNPLMKRQPPHMD